MQMILVRLCWNAKNGCWGQCPLVGEECGVTHLIQICRQNYSLDGAINREIPASEVSLFWDTNLIICDITTQYNIPVLISNTEILNGVLFRPWWQAHVEVFQPQWSWMVYFSDHGDKAHVDLLTLVFGQFPLGRSSSGKWHRVRVLLTRQQRPLQSFVSIGNLLVDLSGFWTESFPCERCQKLLGVSHQAS